MPKCDFDLFFHGKGENLFSVVRQEIGKARGSLRGNANSGIFFLPTPFGEITGKYEIIESRIRIVITEKPWLIPCSSIENKIRSYIVDFEFVLS